MRSKERSRESHALPALLTRFSSRSSAAQMARQGSLSDEAISEWEAGHG